MTSAEQDGLTNADHLTIPPQLNRRGRMALEVKDVEEGGAQLHFLFQETSIPPQLDRHADLAAECRVDTAEESKDKAWRELALRLIDRGYRELAKEQNPDTGGRSDNTALLKDVRKRLKQLCRDWTLGIAAGL
jgi:hypothetical protein